MVSISKIAGVVKSGVGAFAKVELTNLKAARTALGLIK